MEETRKSTIHHLSLISLKEESYRTNLIDFKSLYKGGKMVTTQLIAFYARQREVTASRQYLCELGKEIHFSLPNELFDGVENGFSLFLGCMNQTSSETKQTSTVFAAERTGHFLFHFRHSDIPFGLIFIKGNVLVSQKS